MRSRFLFLALILVVPAGVVAQSTDAPPILAGLGKHSFPITTAKPLAQTYFDQGLVLLYGFNHDEALRAFRHAAKLDPKCAMAYWGIAQSHGPHINRMAMTPERAKEAWTAAQRAKTLAGEATPVEQALIDAVAVRFAETPPEDRAPLDAAYAAAMKKAWFRFPDQADVSALYAEAMMDLKPWDLWVDGHPRPETVQVLSALEASMAKNPNHPLTLHLTIHALEASPNPGKAKEAADRLRELCPGVGHLVHMPSHIDVRTGDWQAAVVANQKAVAADRVYEKINPDQKFVRIYMAHNHHMLSFAAMMQGQSQLAMKHARDMLAEIPAAWLEDSSHAAFADGLFAMPLEVMMRFGQWDAILKEPEPEERFPIARALRHAIRGVAFAAQNKTEAARESQSAFRKAVGQVPEDARFGNNVAADVLAVADGLLEGEILIREGTTDKGLAALRAAVKKEDALRYDEPPDWIHPVRHALGASLLRAKQPAEAEAVYRQDLATWPKNGWSLFGLAASLEAQGKTAEAAVARKNFEEAWRHADVAVTSSCFCQPGQ